MSKTDDLRRSMRHVPQYVAAEFLKLTVQWLQKQDDAPRNPDKTYDLYALHEWDVRRKVAQAEERNISDENPDDLRWKAARADQKEIEVARMKGELWPAEEVKVEVARAFEATKRTLLSFPARLAPQITGLPVEEVAQLMDGAIRDALDELGEALKVEEPVEIKDAV